MGYAVSMSHLGGVILPLFAVYLTESNPAIPYFYYSILSFITAYAAYNLPFDLMG